MATPTTPEMQRIAVEAFERWERNEKWTMLDLLGQWVSEIEPKVIYGNSVPTHIRGIGMADDPAHRVIIKNPNFRPGLLDMIMRCEVHDCDKLATQVHGGRSFMSCPMCNAERIDAWQKQPGTITIRVGRG